MWTTTNWIGRDTGHLYMPNRNHHRLRTRRVLHPIFQEVYRTIITQSPPKTSTPRPQPKPQPSPNPPPQSKSTADTVPTPQAARWWWRWWRWWRRWWWGPMHKRPAADHLGATSVHDSHNPAAYEAVCWSQRWRIRVDRSNASMDADRNRS